MIEQLEFMYIGVFFHIFLCCLVYILLELLHNVINSLHNNDIKLHDFFAKGKGIHINLSLL